jgi:hypothetical protein
MITRQTFQKELGLRVRLYTAGKIPVFALINQCCKDANFGAFYPSEGKVSTTADSALKMAFCPFCGAKLQVTHIDIDKAQRSPAIVTVTGGMANVLCGNALVIDYDELKAQERDRGLTHLCNSCSLGPCEDCAYYLKENLFNQQGSLISVCEFYDKEKYPERKSL